MFKGLKFLSGDKKKKDSEGIILDLDKDIKLDKKNDMDDLELVAVIAAAMEYHSIDDLELVAIITAAVAAQENISANQVVVRTIKKVVQKNSIWAQMGRIEQMAKLR